MPGWLPDLIDAKHRMVAGIWQFGEARVHSASADLPVGRDNGCPARDRYLARLEGLHLALAGERGLAGRAQIADPVRFPYGDTRYRMPSTSTGMTGTVRAWPVRQPGTSAWRRRRFEASMPAG